MRRAADCAGKNETPASGIGASELGGFRSAAQAAYQIQGLGTRTAMPPGPRRAKNRPSRSLAPWLWAAGGLAALAAGIVAALPLLRPREAAKPDAPAARASTPNPIRDGPKQEDAKNLSTSREPKTTAAIPRTTEKADVSTRKGKRGPPPVGEIRAFRDGTAAVIAIALTRDNRFLLTGGGDNHVRLWEVGTGKKLHTFLDTAAASSACRSLPTANKPFPPAQIRRFASGTYPAES